MPKPRLEPEIRLARGRALHLPRHRQRSALGGRFALVREFSSGVRLPGPRGLRSLDGSRNLRLPLVAAFSGASAGRRKLRAGLPCRQGR